MKTLSEFQFQIPTTYDDGVTPISPTDVIAYLVMVDTVTPPVKAYSVPAAAAAAAVNGVVTVKFTELGFVPVNKTVYYADAEAEEGQAVSLPSNIQGFTYNLTPKAPTGFTVG
jgi:hypothetical protein